MSTMSGMTEEDGLWNWCAAGHIDAALLHAALSGALQRPVTTFDAPADDAVICDVWHVGGDFPTLIDCYLTPGGVAEATIASAVAVRLGTEILLPDDTFNPTRYLQAEPDGTLRPVHVEEQETDAGTERRHARPCTGSDPACATAPGCSTSRWKSGPAPGAPAAA
jgi:hypothetical protein